MEGEKKLQRRLWVVTELYAPDDAATAHLLTQIAEHCAKSFDVSVVCAQPTYTHRGQAARAKEKLNGVDVFRCWSTTFPKDRLVLRVINVFTITCSFIATMLFRFRRGDIVLVVTNPPPLPFVANLAAKFRGAKIALLIHDIYPDVFVPTGITSSGSLLYRIVDRFNRRLLRSVDRIISIGRCMSERTARKCESLASKITFIPNWYDESFEPVSRDENSLLPTFEFQDKLIVQYSGNMGRTHGLQVIAEAANILQEQGYDQIHFMMCGWGGGKPSLEDLCRKLELSNVSIHDPFPREQLAELIGVATVSIISFKPGMDGISVPSRMYNILAAGCPIVGVCESNAELAMTIEDHSVGWVTPPQEPEALAELLIRIHEKSAQEMSEIRLRCQRTVHEHFNREAMLEKYVETLDSL